MKQTTYKLMLLCPLCLVHVKIELLTNLEFYFIFNFNKNRSKCLDLNFQKQQIVNLRHTHDAMYRSLPPKYFRNNKSRSGGCKDKLLADLPRGMN